MNFNSFRFALSEKFWSFWVAVELLYGRTKRRIESWWVLRKKEKTEWSDVWKYLDRIDKRHKHDPHIKRLEFFSAKRHEAWQKKIDHKYSVKL